MTDLREITDNKSNNVTKLHYCFLPSALKEHLESYCQLPGASLPLSLLIESIASIRDRSIVEAIKVERGKIILPPATDKAIAQGIEAMERTIHEMARRGDKGVAVRRMSASSGLAIEQYSIRSSQDETFSAGVATSKKDDCELVIDPELRQVIPIDNSSTEALKQDIKVRGIQTPIRYWVDNGKKIIIDGCRRYEIALELGIDYPQREEFYSSRLGAIDARIEAHLNLRNLSTNAINYLIGARYVFALSTNSEKKNTASALGKLYGKTDTSIRNHGNFYRAIEYICNNLNQETQGKFKSKLFAHEIKFTLEELKLVHYLDTRAIVRYVNCALAIGRIPKVPKLEVGTTVKLKPAIGNRELDNYVEQLAMYAGLSEAGKPLVEVEGEYFVVDIDEIEDYQQWIERTEQLAPPCNTYSKISKENNRLYKPEAETLKACDDLEDRDSDRRHSNVRMFSKHPIPEVTSNTSAVHSLEELIDRLSELLAINAFTATQLDRLKKVVLSNS